MSHEWKLALLRREIDHIDDQIVGLLTKRFTVVESVGKTKKKLELPVQDNKREEDILKRIASITPKRYKSLILKIFKTVFTVSQELENS